jgi:hypothetical protein
MSGNSDLKQRTKSFALRIIKVVDALPNTRSANVIGSQLLRSGTSIGANYRAACRARSTARLDERGRRIGGDYSVFDQDGTQTPIIA